MTLNKYDTDFWNMLEDMVLDHNIIIDRPKGTRHLKHPDYVYPLDYGYLDKTMSSDGNGIDIWIGSKKNKRICGIISSIDSVKSDSEIKILYGCSNEEIQMIYEQHNSTAGMKGILLLR